MTQAIPRRFLLSTGSSLSTALYHPHALLPGCLLFHAAAGFLLDTQLCHSAASRTLAGAVLNFLFASLYIPLFSIPSEPPQSGFLGFSMPTLLVQQLLYNRITYRTAFHTCFLCMAMLMSVESGVVCVGLTRRVGNLVFSHQYSRQELSPRTLRFCEQVFFACVGSLCVT
jgi:hypothetical protein